MNISSKIFVQILTSEPLNISWREMVCDGVQVQAQFAMSAIPPGVQVTSGGQDQGVVLPAGDGGHWD